MPSPDSSRRNLAKAKAKWKPPIPWRSSKESGMIRSLVWQWFQRRPSLARRVYPVCPRYKSRSHRLKAGRCRCGYDRSIVGDSGCDYVGGARKLARQLGVSHSWVLRLIRGFMNDPARQERYERAWGGATLAALKAEQAERQMRPNWYRARRIRRKSIPNPQRDALEAKLQRYLEHFRKTGKPLLEP